MTKKHWLMVLIAVLLALSVVALLLVFLLPKNERPINLTLSCQDVIVDINEISPIDVTVNMPTARLVYEIEDTTIATIENGQVRGLAVGKTMLIVTATFKDQTVSTQAMITVREKNFRFEFYSLQHCQSNGLTLFYSSPASFSYRLYDEYGNIIVNASNPTISVTEGISYSLEFGKIVLSGKKDGFLTLEFIQYSFKVTIRLVFSEEVIN
jgi:hypothetical protein